jgi:hypothetical protein
MIRVKRINKENVQPVAFINDVEDKRPVKGRDIFPEIYANIFLCARKKSGKSCVIYHTIKQCATTETRVIAFVSSLKRDKTWPAIEELYNQMKVNFTAFTSIYDSETKEDILDSIVKELEATSEVEETAEEEEVPRPASALIMQDDEEPRTQKKKKRPKEKAPKIIFVFYDLSTEVKAPSLTALMKKNRHFKSKIIIASQYWNDMDLQARKQIDYVLLFQGLSKSLTKLSDIYKNCDLSIPFELFVDLYRFCTSERFHFMWIDVINSKFRKDFSYKLEIPKDTDDDPQA